MKLLHTIIFLALINTFFLIAIVFFGTKNSAVNSKIPILNSKVMVSITPSPTLNPVTSATVSTATPTPVLTVVVTANPTVRPTTVVTAVPTAAPTTVATVAPTAATQTNSNACLIQVDGVSYDVTSFRNQHSGGDIFQCGTDMSSIFWSRHNSRILDMMAAYRI